MTEPLRKKLHQLAAVGLLLGAIAIALALTVLPLAGYITGQQAEIEQRRELLGRFEAFTSAKGKVEALASQSDEAMRAGIFLAGETDALRAANLQALLTKAAATHGVRIRSARTLAPAEHDGLRFIGVQAEIDTGVQQLQAMILAFESMRPYLFIQTLQVSPHDTRGLGSEELKVRIGIAGAVAPANGKG
jgi:hypothetical protein